MAASKVICFLRLNVDCVTVYETGNTILLGDYIGTKPSAEYRKIKIVITDNLISTISVNTTNENIKVNSLSFTENISLDTNGGNIICERVSVGKSINLKAKDSNITGSIIGGWDDFSISCKIKNGDCNLPTFKEDGKKSFFADCNNGNINIDFVKLII